MMLLRHEQMKADLDNQGVKMYIFTKSLIDFVIITILSTNIKHFSLILDFHRILYMLVQEWFIVMFFRPAASRKCTPKSIHCMRFRK